MGATNGVGDVSVGLGNKKDNPKDVIAGPGTATLHFPWQDMGALMAAHGQFLESLIADYPADPREQTAATVNNPLVVKNGWTRATFSNARIMSVQVVPGGVVKVTLQHFGVSTGPPAPSYATYNTTKSNIKSSGGRVGEWQQLVASAKPTKPIKQAGSATYDVAAGTAS